MLLLFCGRPDTNMQACLSPGPAAVAPAGEFAQFMQPGACAQMWVA